MRQNIIVFSTGYPGRVDFADWLNLRKINDIFTIGATLVHFSSEGKNKKIASNPNKKAGYEALRFARKCCVKTRISI